MRSLLFAIDYDDTLTACPELWAKWISQIRESGHRCVCITARRDTEENREEMETFLNQFGIEISMVFSNLGPKIDCAEKRGMKVDIWIDDNPTALVKGH